MWTIIIIITTTIIIVISHVIYEFRSLPVRTVDVCKEVKAVPIN